MVPNFSTLADALLAGGAVQILVGLAILRFALGLTDLVVGVAIGIIAVSLALSGQKTQNSVASSNLDGKAAYHQALINRFLASEATRKPTPARNPPAIAAAPKAQQFDTPASAGELRAQVAIADIRRGLIWGVTLLIPFLLIDVLIAHLFAMLEWNTLSAQTVATPLKLIVFLSIGGWQQLSAWLAGAAALGISP